MSYLVWNLNHQAVIGLCIATAFFRSDWTNDTSFEEIISFYFDKEIEDFGSLGELVNALESHAYSVELLEIANSYLDWVYNNDPPAGLRISMYDLYDSLYDLSDLFDE
jgi:hypothetical protein